MHPFVYLFFYYILRLATDNHKTKLSVKKNLKKDVIYTVYDLEFWFKKRRIRVILLFNK